MSWESVDDLDLHSLRHHKEYDSVVVTDETRCEWCGELFERKSTKGRAPKYCCGAHKQRASEERRRNEALREVLSGLASAQGETARIQESLAAATMPGTEAMRSIGESLAAATMPDTETVRQLQEMASAATMPGTEAMRTIQESLAAATMPGTEAMRSIGESLAAATMPGTEAMRTIQESLAAATMPGTETVRKLQETASAATMPGTETVRRLQEMASAATMPGTETVRRLQEMASAATMPGTEAMRSIQESLAAATMPGTEAMRTIQEIAAQSTGFGESLKRFDSAALTAGMWTGITSGHNGVDWASTSKTITAEFSESLRHFGETGIAEVANGLSGQAIISDVEDLLKDVLGSIETNAPVETSDDVDFAELRSLVICMAVLAVMQARWLAGVAAGAYATGKMLVDLFAYEVNRNLTLEGLLLLWPSIYKVGKSMWNSGAGNQAGPPEDPG